MADQSWAHQPFREALAFFQNKGRAITTTDSWLDMRKSAHDHGFTVAGLTRTAAVEDFFNAAMRQLRDGISFRDFQKDFDSIVDKYGWAHKGSRAWRSRVLFETNIRTAYTAGQWAHMQSPAAKKALPYIQYRHSGAEHFRPLHKAWDGLVLPAGDAFWKTNLPPNGFGCKCTWFPLSARSLKRLGKDGPDENPYAVMAANGEKTTYTATDPITGQSVAVPRGVDFGWDYLPGDSWLRSVSPSLKSPAQLAEALGLTESVRAWNALDVGTLDDFPPARLIDPQSLSDPAADATTLIRDFLKPFGADIGKPAAFTDVTGDTVIVSEDMFIRKSTDELKVLLSDRIRYLPLYERTLREPDQIRIVMEASRDSPGDFRLYRRYLARFVVGDDPTPILVSFVRSEDDWTGATAFNAKLRSFKNQLIGKLIYARK